jgi:hypothetical protein
MIGPNGQPSGIALSEIESYARMFGFETLDDRFDLMNYIKVCDDTWLAEMNKRRKPVGNSGKHTTGRR